MRLALAAFKAGGTFSYAGQVTGLDPAIEWGAKSSAVAIQAICHDWPALDVTFAKASDWNTTHKYDLALFASAEDTREWRLTTIMAFDILFFDNANPDPVIITATVQIPILQPITPAPP